MIFFPAFFPSFFAPGFKKTLKLFTFKWTRKTGSNVQGTRAQKRVASDFSARDFSARDAFYTIDVTEITGRFPEQLFAPLVCARHGVEVPLKRRPVRDELSSARDAFFTIDVSEMTRSFHDGPFIPLARAKHRATTRSAV